MPKLVDYSGRFAFFELAAFTLVRDHGVDSLSRHGVARVLATSISTVRRLLDPGADLRSLALNEVGVRRRRRLGGRHDRGTGVDAALGHLATVVPFDERHVAEELVWWRLAVAAPSTAQAPVDNRVDVDEQGPLHHRFAVATYGYVPADVRHTRVQPPTTGFVPPDDPDVVVAARRERDLDVAARAGEALVIAVPEPSPEEVARLAPVLHAVVDGLGLAVALGRLTPAEAREVARAHLESVVRRAR